MGTQAPLWYNIHFPPGKKPEKELKASLRNELMYGSVEEDGDL